MGRSRYRRDRGPYKPSAYKQRDMLLAEIGFDSYADYLQSTKWRIIRQHVMDDAKGQCCNCDRKATQVHHTEYTRANLSGSTIKGMVAICRICHDAIEFGKGGGKRPLDIVNWTLWKMQNGKAKAKVRRRRRRKTKPDPTPRIEYLRAERQRRAQAFEQITLERATVSRAG